jgi:hypothetical protein
MHYGVVGQLVGQLHIKILGIKNQIFRISLVSIQIIQIYKVLIRPTSHGSKAWTKKINISLKYIS